jgi:hypothetical protein
MVMTISPLKLNTGALMPAIGEQKHDFAGSGHLTY